MWCLAVDLGQFPPTCGCESGVFGWDDPSWPQDPNDFVRRGIACSYRDEMPAEYALELFMDVAGPTLRRAGYPVADLGFGI